MTSGVDCVVARHCTLCQGGLKRKREVEMAIEKAKPGRIRQEAASGSEEPEWPGACVTLPALSPERWT